MDIEENVFDHILYEFYMYLRASVSRADNQFVNNLLVDSREVHLRNLVLFFSEKKESNIHYSTYINVALPDAVDRKTHNEIQKVLSNATCHLLAGRMESGFKRKTVKAETDIFPRMRRLIRRFVQEMNRYPRPEYTELWKDPEIQGRAEEILGLTQELEWVVLEPVTTE